MGFKTSQEILNYPKGVFFLKDTKDCRKRRKNNNLEVVGVDEWAGKQNTVLAIKLLRVTQRPRTEFG